MKTSKCLMGIMLSSVLLIGSVFAANTLSQDVKKGIWKKGQISVYNEIRSAGEYNDNTNRDCTDCEFDFTAYGSECCDSAWDEFGINCADLEANYNWDCSGCTCPGDQEGECGDGNCNINEDCETCEADCGVCGECGDGQVADCADNDCCPESWIGDGFTDCEDQQYGCDLTCYDNDGGDCDGSTTTGGTTGGTADCEDCELDWSAYGSECCDTAWDEYGINCADLEGIYGWDCAGCNCPGDGDPVCGDGSCNGDETYETCPDDCNAPGECDAGYITDCADDDCCPESWIGDGFADCEDQAYGCDLTCYDNDGGDCVDPECGDGACNGDESYETCPEDCNEPGSECSEGFCDEGTYWDGFSCYDCSYCTDISDDSACDDPYDCCGMCGGTAEGTCGDPVCGDGFCNGDETYETCPDDCSAPGECDPGYITDCVDDDCCPESWIGDGFEDCEDQAYGCDLTCYDNDGGDCPEACENYTCWDGSCVDNEADCPDAPEVPDAEGVCIAGENYAGYPAVTVSWDIETVCGDGVCNGDESYDTCPDDCNAPGECDDGYITDCVDDDCCPESWIGDGFADCEDQAYGCDLTCYDNDGGDCDGSTTTGGTTGGTESCDDCEFDFTPYGSECCDTAWDEFGINCADLEANYSWDCSGCSCPGDSGGTTGGTTGGDCDAGYITDCVDDDCCPESWIGDGFEDCEDQAYGCDLTCYDNDGGDCDGSTTTGGTTGGTEGCTDCEFDFTAYGSECCDTAWDEFGIDCMTLEANYNWDCSGCNCPGDGEAVCGDGFCSGDETYDNCPDDCLPPGECPDGQIVDCDGTNECWPESWIGDGFPDCNDQQYGADLTCYDCDGGDCPGTDPGCTSCAEQGLIECDDGSCVASEEDCPAPEDCPAGTIADCSGDGDCGFDTWIGDGYCDGSSQEYGIDNCCYDNDGGDCTDEECAGGRAQVASGIKKGYELTSLQNGRMVDVIRAEKQSAISLRDGVVVHGGSQAVRFNEVIDNTNRVLNATVALSCADCLSGGPWEGSWEVEAMAFGYFTVYGFDAGALVCGTVTFCDGGACSETSEEVCAVAGDADSVDCAEGGSDCPSEAGSGDVNGDGDSNVLDIVSIVNYILGTPFADECAADAADVNGDGVANVLDIVQIVNGILGGRVDDASSAKLIKSDEAVILEADGYIGGVQMTLSHDGDFSIDLTDKAMVAEYNTVGNETILVIVAPEGEELFTYSGDFEIVDMIVANSQDRVNVGAPTEFSLSTAFPNPFNPTTSLELSVPMNGQVTVQVYNLMGQVVATLANGYMDASIYSLTWDASNVSSGMYIVKAEAAGTVSTQKLMLMK